MLRFTCLVGIRMVDGLMVDGLMVDGLVVNRLVVDGFVVHRSLVGVALGTGGVGVVVRVALVLDVSDVAVLVRGVVDDLGAAVGEVHVVLAHGLERLST